MIAGRCLQMKLDKYWTVNIGVVNLTSDLVIVEHPCATQWMGRWVNPDTQVLVCVR
jgi:hypothetical protein